MRSLTLLLLLALVACTTSVDDKSSLPPTTGALNELVIVVDEALWQGELGDSIRSVLAMEVPGIAWQEPIFDLVQIPKKAFSRIFQTHRNLLIIEKGDKSELGFERSVYAKGQQLALMRYQRKEDLLPLWEQYGPVIAHRFTTVEKERLGTKVSKQKGLEQLFSKHSVSLSVPKDFTLVLDTTSFSWLEYSPADKEEMQGIFVYELPYVEHLSTWPLLKGRDSVLQQYVHGAHENSYMTLERLYSPFVRHTETASLPTLEVKGCWKMQNAFMGGPFISRFVQDTVNQRTLVLEAFLFNPGKDKRDPMMQLQWVLESAVNQ